MLNHWIIMIFIFAECLAPREASWRVTQPPWLGHVSHYVKFRAELGNEGKMMHFNHLKEPAKTNTRNSIRLHCNMQLVFSGHTYRTFYEKMYLVESLFSLQLAQKYPIYIPDFPHIQSPHSIKLSCSDLVTLTTVCSEASEGGAAQLSVVCWLSLRTHVRRALRGYWVISVPHKWTRGPLSQSEFGHFQVTTYQHIHFGSWQFYPRSAQNWL